MIITAKALQRNVELGGKLDKALVSASDAVHTYTETAVLSAENMGHGRGNGWGICCWPRVGFKLVDSPTQLDLIFILCICICQLYFMTNNKVICVVDQGPWQGVEYDVTRPSRQSLLFIFGFLLWSFIILCLSYFSIQATEKCSNSNVQGLSMMWRSHLVLILILIWQTTNSIKTNQILRRQCCLGWV